MNITPNTSWRSPIVNEYAAARRESRLARAAIKLVDILRRRRRLRIPVATSSAPMTVKITSMSGFSVLSLARIVCRPRSDLPTGTSRVPVQTSAPRLHHERRTRSKGGTVSYPPPHHVPDGVWDGKGKHRVTVFCCDHQSRYLQYPRGPLYESAVHVGSCQLHGKRDRLRDIRLTCIFIETGPRESTVSLHREPSLPRCEGHGPFPAPSRRRKAIPSRTSAFSSRALSLLCRALN